MLLITGITGHSGKYFLKELIKNNYDTKIRVVIRWNDSIDYLEQSGLNIEILSGDLNNQSFLDEALKGVDTLFHIASIFYSVNVVKAAVSTGIKRIILVHTTGIYSKFKSASYEYKTIEEQVHLLIGTSGKSIELTILRPTMIFGYENDRNIYKFIRFADKLPIIPVIDRGNGLIQPVHGRDLGKAYFQVLVSNNLGHEYVLSGERSLSMLELFTLIGQYLGKQKYIISIPSQLGVLLAQIAKIVTLGRLDYVERVQRMSENRNFSHEQATRDFNYDPDSFNDNLKNEVLLYMKRKGQ